jgi:hypothetical protein
MLAEGMPETYRVGPVMALMRHAGRARQCLLLGVQQTRCAHVEFFRS